MSRAMIKSIKNAAGNASMTDGLRAIRRFEKINGIAFNPKDRNHNDNVKSYGEHERFFRKMKRILKSPN